MDLKQVKPIHLKCPDCGYDFAYNTNHIESEIDRLKTEMASITSQIQEFKSKNQDKCWHKNKWYQKAKTDLKFKQAELLEIKKARKATATEIKLQIFSNYRNIVKSIVGKEKELEMIKEAEDEMIYYEYDLAVQNFTRFDGI